MDAVNFQRANETRSNWTRPNETERGVLPTGVFPTGVLPIGVFPTAGGDSPTSRLQLGVPLQLQFSLKIRLLSIKDFVC